MESELRKCKNCQQEFNVEPEDFEFYKKIDVPPPTFCPDCRLQRRLAWRNDRTLYKSKCDLSGENIISIFTPESPYTVYSVPNWWSDKWDPLEYGLEYDFEKPFFEQFDKLLKTVPLTAAFVVDHSRMINSPYNNMVLDLKNCYMLSNSDFCEDSAWGVELEESKSCVDTNLVHQSEYCYEVVNCAKCHRTFFSEDCRDSFDLWFSKDCSGCNNCFGCVNLRNKSYHIFNEPFSKEEYEKKLESFNLDSRASLNKFKKISEQKWVENGKFKYYHGRQNDSVTGDYVYNSKNVKNSWMVNKGRDLKYCQYIVSSNMTDSYDVSQFGRNNELHYESLQVGNGGSRVKFSWFVVTENIDVEYCVMTLNSRNCFGCVGLRNKEYCIFNRQYSKEEYREMVSKIKKHMDEQPYVDKKGRSYRYGEFFPIELSPFAYNETTAQEYFPLDKEKAKGQEYRWKDPTKNEYTITIDSYNIPDKAKDIPENILKEVLECSETGRAFRISRVELDFYKQQNIPLPDVHPDVRHARRMKRRNPIELHNRKCMKDGCGTEFETTYAPERKEIVYCESCYNKEVI